MMVWPHAASSQRATWPPRAAVLQLSMADITFSWPRLTWPRLASRQAAPWSRKMSATSRAGRDMTVGDLCRRLGPVSRQRETIQWAHHHTDRVAGYPRVERCRVEPGVSEQDLDQTNVGF